MELDARWRRLWQAAATSDAEAEYADICTAYSERHRAYHTIDHVGHCLNQLDATSEPVDHPVAVELAIWFHDVVYQPYSSGNEEASAAWARSSLQRGGAPAALVDLVSGLIMATCHSHPPDDPDQRLMVDIDLAVLGQAPQQYDLYEEQIRREYRWVPGPLFRRRRASLLSSFLERPRIYGTSWFHQSYEGQARSNLQRAIERLGEQ